MSKSVCTLENEAPYAVKDKQGAKYHSCHEPHLELARYVDGIMLLVDCQCIVILQLGGLALVKVALMIIRVIPSVVQAGTY